MAIGTSVGSRSLEPAEQDRYDVFISYARKSSSREALAIRRGLERYNRPWNRARSTRVFVDDQSMSATYSLEGAIASALAGSRWLMVLLSDAAAQSPWVNKEIAWWLVNRDPAKLLLVHVNGSVSWLNADFTTSSTAVPPALRGALQHEPRWIDLTWFEREGGLGEEDPRFTERILELFCPIHGMDRDTAAAANSVVVRRAKRLARGAVTALSLLLALAIVAAGLAWWQRGIAVEQTRAATARQVAAESQQVRESDIGRSRLLAVQAWSMRDDPLTRSAMLGSLLASPSLDQQLAAPGEIIALAGSADGHVVFAGLSDGQLLRWVPGEGSSKSMGTLDGPVTQVASSADGRVVVAGGKDGTTPVRVWQDGREVGGTLPAGWAAVSRSGRTVAVNSRVSAGNAQTVLSIWHLDPDGALTRWVDTPATGHNIGLPSDDQLVVQGSGPKQEVLTQRYSLPDFVLIATTVSEYDGIPDQDPILSPFGDAGFNAYRVVDTGRDDPAATGRRPTSGADPGRILYREVFALSADGHSLVTSNAGRLEVRTLDLSGQVPTQVRTAWGGSAVTALVAMPGTDIVLSANGRIATRWLLSNPQPLTQMVELRPDGVSLHPCDDCGVPGPHPDAGGGVVAVPTGDQFPDLTNLRIVARDGRDVPDVPRRVFLAWRDSTRYFASVSDAPGLIESRTIGRTAPDETWRLSGVTAGVWDGHWYHDRQTLTLIVNGRLHHIDVESGRSTSTGVTVDQISPDGTLLVTSAMDGSTRTSRVLRADTLEEVHRAQGWIYLTGDHAMVAGGANTTLLANGTGPDLPVAARGLHEIAVSPDGAFYLARDQVGVLTVHARTTGMRVGSFAVAEDVLADSSASFSADGSTAVALMVGSGTRDDSLAFYDLRPTVWRDRLCDSVGRPLTLEDWRIVTAETDGPDGPLACT